MTISMNRKELIQKRKQIPDRQEKDFRIACGLLPFFKLANRIALYLPVRGEVDVVQFLQLADEKKTQSETLIDLQTQREQIWLVPKVESETVMRFYPLDHLEPGAFGILEPAGKAGGQKEEVPELLIIPLLAFCDGYRMGYGGGYYDRYLQAHPLSIRIGIAYDEQEADFQPAPWDERLDVMITPTRILYYPNPQRKVPEELSALCNEAKKDLRRTPDEESGDN